MRNVYSGVFEKRRVGSCAQCTRQRNGAARTVSYARSRRRRDNAKSDKTCLKIERECETGKVHCFCVKRT